MNPFLKSSDERLSDWKALRHQIAEMSDEDALNAVAAFWAQAPLSAFSHDPEQADTWPSPWQMVSAGEWSKHTIAIGMEFTLRLAGWSPERLKLVFLRDYDISEEIMILKIDDKFVLNYTVKSVIEYPRTEQIILCEWQYRDKKYELLAG